MTVIEIIASRETKEYEGRQRITPPSHSHFVPSRHHLVSIIPWPSPGSEMLRRNTPHRVLICLYAERLKLGIKLGLTCVSHLVTLQM